MRPAVSEILAAHGNPPFGGEGSGPMSDERKVPEDVKDLKREDGEPEVEGHILKSPAAPSDLKELKELKELK